MFNSLCKFSALGALSHRGDEGALVLGVNLVEEAGVGHEGPVVAGALDKDPPGLEHTGRHTTRASS